MFTQDASGRTALHHAAARGDLDAAWGIMSTLAGTGIFPPRKSLLEIRDNAGMTAAEVAAERGHAEVAEALNHEWARMELFE